MKEGSRQALGLSGGKCSPSHINAAGDMYALTQGKKKNGMGRKRDKRNGKLLFPGKVASMTRGDRIMPVMAAFCEIVISKKYAA